MMAAVRNMSRLSHPPYQRRKTLGFIARDGGDAIRRAVTRDFYRPGLVNGISTTFNDTVVDSLSYTYDALSRPTSRNSDVFAYNDRSEVISAQIGTNLFAHDYDSIGNQTNHVANAVAEYTYDAFGRTAAQSGSMADIFRMGKLRFSVEIIPDVLGVHIYRRQIKTFNPVSDNRKMAIACAKEQDHVAIARLSMC